MYIHREDWEFNKQLFVWLCNEKETVEQELGTKLEWERLDDKKGSRIALDRAGSITSEPPTLQEIRVWTIEQLVKFKRAFGPRLKRYGSNLKSAPAGA